MRLLFSTVFHLTPLRENERRETEYAKILLQSNTHLKSELASVLGSRTARMCAKHEYRRMKENIYENIFAVTKRCLLILVKSIRSQVHKAAIIS